MDLGEEIDIRGPSGSITYQGRGDFEIGGQSFHFTKVSLIDRCRAHALMKCPLDQPSLRRERFDSSLAAHPRDSLGSGRRDPNLPYQ